MARIGANDVSRSAKLIGDKVLAGLCLIFFGPILLGITLLIMCGSRGPVIVKRAAVDANGSIFEAWTFRTDAASRNGGKAAAGTRLRDIFVSFLKISRAENLPGLMNILRGEIPFAQLLATDRYLLQKSPAITGREANSGRRGGEWRLWPKPALLSEGGVIWAKSLQLKSVERAPLLWIMLKKIGVDRRRLDHSEFDLDKAAMVRRCIACRNTATCARWLDGPEQFDGYKWFCPNAAALENLHLAVERR